MKNKTKKHQAEYGYIIQRWLTWSKPRHVSKSRALYPLCYNKYDHSTNDMSQKLCEHEVNECTVH